MFFYQSAKQHLGVTKLAFDDPEGMLNLGPCLRFGVFNLAQRAANGAFFPILSTTAGSGADRPDHLLPLMFRSLFHAGIVRVATDMCLFAMQQLIDLGNGVLQGSCRVSRVFYAAIFSVGCSLSGLSVTVQMGCQFRVAPDQRCGC